MLFRSGNFDLPELQKQLDDALEKRYKHESGAELRIVSAAIDTGHKTKSVYNYCKPRFSRRIYAVKGSPTPAAPIIRASFQKTSRVWLHTLGTDGLKDSLFSRLQIKEVGHRYCHFPQSATYNEEYFRQLTSEVVRKKFEKGQWRRIYVKIRERNEALDKRVYALAAYEILRPNMEALASQLVKQEKPDTTEYQLKAEPKAQPAARPFVKPFRKSGGFIGGWR